METMTRRFVPAYPTLRAEMLWANARQGPFPPFAATARYFYLARNAVWHAVQRLGLVGKEVLMPAYHHGVEVEAVLQAGARVSFYPVGEGWTVDPEAVSARMGPATGALYLIHFAGFPGPIREMRRLADARGIPLIEDCALSLFSSDGDLALGTLGDAAIFCLYKTLPIPNGGALVWNGKLLDSFAPNEKSERAPRVAAVSRAVNAWLENLELRGGRPGRWARQGVRALGRRMIAAAPPGERVSAGSQSFNPAHVRLGISPLALRLARTQDAEGIVARRRRNYSCLQEKLEPVSPPLRPELGEGVCPLFYPVVVEDKPKVLSRLWERGIQAVDLWDAFHPACDPGAFPEAARYRRSVVEIPCHQDLDPECMEWVADVTRAVLARGR